MYALSPVLTVGEAIERTVEIVESSGSTTVAEDGGTDTYTLVLNTEPASDVTVVVESADATALQVKVGNLGAWGTTAAATFKPSNFNRTQRVQVRGVDDSIKNPGGSRAVLVTHSVQSVDPDYDGIAADSVQVTVTDDEGADAVFDAVPSDLRLAENADGSTTAIRVGSPVTATDADSDPVSYSLEGWRPPAWPSGAPSPRVPPGFVIDASSGQISYTGTGLDRESLRDPVSMAVGSVSMVVVATSAGVDGTDAAVRQTVTVTVTDVDEGDATVTVDGVASARRGTLRFTGLQGDPDGDPADASGLRFLWQSSADGGSVWNAAPGPQGRDGTYGPVAADVGKLVRLRVIYTDGGGNAETVYSRSLTVVGGGPGQVTATVEVTDAVAVEGTNDRAAISVRLDTSLVAGETVTVPLSFAGATAGTDFTLSVSAAGVAVSGTSVVFTGPTAAAVSVSVSAQSDGDDIGEQVTLSLGTMLATGLAGVQLTPVLRGLPLLILAEPESLRKIDVGLSRSAVAEGGSVAVTVRVPGGPVRADVSVPLVVSGTGVTAADYRLTSPVVIPAGFSEVSTELVVIDDGVTEGAETWDVDLGTLPAGFGKGLAGALAVTDRAAAADGELLVEVTSVDPTVDYRVDGSAGPGRLRIVLSRALASGEKLVVPLAFTGGVLGTDFSLSLVGLPQGVSLSGSTVTFTGPSASVADLAVIGLDDDDFTVEQVSVTVGAPTKTAITETVTSRSSASFVLSDVMAATPAPPPAALASVRVQVSSPDPVAREGSSSGGRLRVALSRALVSGETLAVPLAFTGGVLGTDFSLSLAGSPSGVSLSGATVTFTGPAAVSADLTVVAAQDADSVSRAGHRERGHAGRDGDRRRRQSDIVGVFRAR